MKHPTILPAEFYLVLCGIFIALISGIIVISGGVAIKALLARRSLSETGSPAKRGSSVPHIARRLAAGADLVFKVLALLLFLELAAACLR